MSWSDPKRWQALAMVLLFGVLLWLLAPILTPSSSPPLLGWLGRSHGRTGSSVPGARAAPR
jgi:hypothetical protein